MRELLEAAQARGVEAADSGTTVVGKADPLHPPVVFVLAALGEAAPDEIVDHPAGGGQRDVDDLRGLLEAELARLVLEVVHQLDLAERQLERADRLEQVRVAVLVHEHDQGVEVAGQVRVVRHLCLHAALAPHVSCLHACKYCTQAT